MPNPITISIFFHAGTQPSYALLAASVFRLANRHSGSTVFDIRLVGASDRFKWQDGEIRLQPIDKVSDGYLIIPPMEATHRAQNLSLSEIILLRHSVSAGATIATACLGAFLPAEAGLLDGREATTHWEWVDFATRNYPSVRWNVREMLVDHGDIITAGGLLSIVDLCLHIVRKTQGGPLAHQLGQTLLADTVRQKQSVYATKLVAAPRDANIFEALEREIDRRGGDGLTVPGMAAFCNMSLRSFHRRFQDNYGVTPIKFLQLRRIEVAKTMLAQKELSLDTVAERAGFADMAFFRSVFSRETGMTPGQYRRNMVESG